MNLIGPKSNPDQPRTVAFGGGKGGVGRSTMCAEVARSLARQGQRVLCVDASWSCPALHTFLHTIEPSFDFFEEDSLSIGDDDSHIADFIEDTNHKSIWLFSIASARKFPFTRPNLLAKTIVDQLVELDFDWILIDLPPGLEPLSIGLFTLCDIPLLVCSPEPASIRVTTQFLRACLYHALSFHPDASHLGEDLLDLLWSQPLDLNHDELLDLALELDLEWLVEETLLNFHTYLIVNLVREGAERDLGHVLCHAWHEELGTFPRFLTPVDYEDRRWFYHRRNAGSTSARGDEALSNDIERLVRSISQILSIDQQFPRPIPRDPRAHPALRLGIAPDSSSPNLLRQHCRRLWEGYRREATISLVFKDAEKRQRIAKTIEIFYKSALNLPGEPLAPEPIPHQPPPPYAQNPPVFHEDSYASEGEEVPASPPDPPSFHIHPEQSPGRLIERLRRQHEMSLQDLSQRSHIGIKYLAAIEDANLDILPRPVYLRGYLREIARIFDVSSDELIQEYFRLLGEFAP